MRLLFTLLFFSTWAFSQDFMQSIRGKIVDKETQTALYLVTVVLDGGASSVLSDSTGVFVFENIPIGRHTLSFSSVGYDSQFLSSLELSSGKELILRIELSEKPLFLEEITVKGERSKDFSLNEYALVSGRQFTVQESNRYAGGYADPSRMAMAFAGVTSAGNDQNNEIVIRGNSPKGLLWRLEGVEIPNPNHFGDGQGATSGIISMINSGSLANSDFFTGAFPAEYGNAMSGVFDLRFRRGNSQQHEYMAQLSVIGLEAAVEGPIGKKGASYRFNARYSTLELLFKTGLLQIETGNFKPAYRDMNFTLHFPSKKAGEFSLWGVGGVNSSDDVEEEDITLAQGSMGVMGLSHMYSVNRKGYLKTVISASTEGSEYFRESFRPNLDTWVIRNQNTLFQRNLRLSSFYNYKLNSRISLRNGYVISRLGYSLEENRRNESRNELVNFLNERDHTWFVQAYSQAKADLTPRFKVTGGLHYSIFLLNNNTALEPRFGMEYRINAKQRIQLGAGLHSRMEAVSLYLYKRQNGVAQEQPNASLGLTKAGHLVLGYSLAIREHAKLKIEGYYQHLFQVPLDTNSRSLLSMVNISSGIPNAVLENTGVGENKGIELTLERYFARNYYFLITASLFDSKYLAPDGKWRNTIFNNTYAWNILGGKEFFLGPSKRHVLVLNSRLMWRGGNRFIPVNLAESILRNRTILNNTEAYVQRLPDYRRVDIGIAYKINTKSSTWTLSADIQNVTNYKNIIRERYDTSAKQITYSYALPIIPIFNFKVDF